MRLMAMPSVSTRSRPRFPAYFDATIESGCVTGKGTVLSISDAGLFVATDLRLLPGTRLTVGFRALDLGSVRLPGLVIYAAEVERHLGLGMKFLSPTAGVGVMDEIRSWCQGYGTGA